MEKLHFIKNDVAAELLQHLEKEYIGLANLVNITNEKVLIPVIAITILLANTPAGIGQPGNGGFGGPRANPSNGAGRESPWKFDNTINITGMILALLGVSIYLIYREMAFVAIVIDLVVNLHNAHLDLVHWYLENPEEAKLNDQNYKNLMYAIRDYADQIITWLGNYQEKNALQRKIINILLSWLGKQYNIKNIEDLQLLAEQAYTIS